MASFDKATTSSPSTVEPKPIASVAPQPLSSAFAVERFFSDGDDDVEGDLDDDLEGEEEDEEISNGEGVRGENLSSQETYASPSRYENALVIAEHGYAQNFNRVDRSSSSSGQNDPLGGENNRGGFSRQEGSYWDVLRSHFSDPVTGALMDDAMILPCGHSYGRGGMQQVYKKKACCKCSQPISGDLVRPNLALRSAVQAFLREEEMHLWKVSKRRRNQEKCGYNDPLSNDLSRVRASQFPLSISDRVIIKGNKRTPPHFVGRVAVVTAQCLNGWYVVKTLDNAESIKLQFGSLAKVSTNHQPKSSDPNRAQYSNWL